MAFCPQGYAGIAVQNDGERQNLDADLGLECNPMLPTGWAFELRLHRDTAGDLIGTGLLRLRGVDMCHFTLASLDAERGEALRRIRIRIEAWLAEWQTR